jgi:hypothetical protein
MCDIDINVLLEKLLCQSEFKNSKWTRVFDDPRIDTYYISITKNIYLILYGMRDGFEELILYKYINYDVPYEIMSQNGLQIFANDHQLYNDDNEKIIFEYSFNHDMNMGEIVSLIKNKIKQELN